MTTAVCPHCGNTIAIEPAPVSLTHKQRELVAFIQQYIDNTQIAPTYEEIAIHFGLKSLASVAERLHFVERKGWIRRRHNRVRSIELLHRLSPNGAGDA